MLDVKEYFYQLPESYIAQEPAVPRDAAKLMVVDRQNQTLTHKIFKDLPKLLTPNDFLVINDSKVFPARLTGKKESGGHAEVLLLRPIGNNTWEAMSNGLKPSQTVYFSDSLTGVVVDKNYETGQIFITLSAGMDVIDKVGQIPLPHYIHTSLTGQKLKEEYQTVYAHEAGSAAAPTAGMHFTPKLLHQLHKQGIGIERITLHVGPGTFARLRPEQIQSKTLHAEWYEIKPDVAIRLNEAKKAGKRIVAVGTTSCRTLESASSIPGLINPGLNQTSIFIMPGYKFKFVDAMITNFHLPESSLLMLVTAFIGAATFKASLIGKAYDKAKSQNYRFFSFGDAMLII